MMMVVFHGGTKLGCRAIGVKRSCVGAIGMHEVDTLLDAQVRNIVPIHILRSIPTRMTEVHVLEHLAFTVDIPLIVFLLLCLHLPGINTKTIKLVSHSRDHRRHVIHVLPKVGHADLHTP